jgi:uncharacterized protein YndB with AHSA1/START domain
MYQGGYMANEITLTRFFNIPSRDLYHYFVDSKLLEKWSYPEGMILKVPVFEAQEGGKYRYEHTNEKGTYVCEGHFEQIVPRQSLKMVDDWIKDPTGKLIAENLYREIIFMPLGDGCDVAILQSGFKGEEFVKECEEGWNQGLDHLQSISQRSEIDINPRKNIETDTRAQKL